MTLKEKAICEVYTGYCFTCGNEKKAVQDYMSSLMGRPVWTHEYPTLANRLHELSQRDFLMVCSGEMENKDF